jgi:hypothetical protein
VPKLVGDAGHVNINSYNRKVLLTGEVRDEAMKRAVEREVRGIQRRFRHQRVGRCRPVELYLARATPSSPARSSSAWRQENDLGDLVQGRDRKRHRLPDGPRDPARRQYRRRRGPGVSGVMRVVKMFEYISEEDLRTHVPPQQQQAPCNPRGTS